MPSHQAPGERTSESGGAGAANGGGDPRILDGVRLMGSRYSRNRVKRRVKPPNVYQSSCLKRTQSAGRSLLVESTHLSPMSIRVQVGIYRKSIHHKRKERSKQIEGGRIWRGEVLRRGVSRNVVGGIRKAERGI